jgi:uncharacterized membrane protein YjfL (UPF0719 family)
MSGDETLVFFASYALSGILWIRWYWVLCFAAQTVYSSLPRRKLIFAPFISAGLLFAVLKCFSSFDVRDDPTYLWAYFFMGAAWTSLGINAFSIFGVSARDHVIERKNDAASWLLSGAIIGLTLCFAGANIGDGPGWWVVVFAALLSTGTLFVFWWFLARVGRADDSILLDRDTASGVRLGAFLAASGLILGRAAAGDWVSVEATIKDFLRLSWPAFIMLIAALRVEHRLRPNVKTPQHSIIDHGVVPGVIYLAIAIMVLLWHGSWK